MDITKIRQALVVLSTLVMLVSADFELGFIVRSFSNPQGHCADSSCTPDCPGDACQYFFELCFSTMPVDSPVSFVRAPNQGGCGFNIRKPDSGTLTEGSVTGNSIGVTISESAWPQEGVQLFFELLGTSNQGNVLVDRFAVNVTDVPIGSSRTQTHSGIFGLAMLEATTTLACSENHIGPDCNTECLSEPCTCPAGFTGEFCATSINDCVGVACGENQRCVDGLLNYTCVCEPGFTGPDCLTNINDCESVNCNSGTCEDGVNAFTCICNPGFTGEFCSDGIDDCAGVDCGENRTCVDGHLSHSCECTPDSECLTNTDSNCATVNCNNGECITDTVSTQCTCDPGFTGEQCETVMSTSSATPMDSTSTTVTSPDITTTAQPPTPVSTTEVPNNMSQLTVILLIVMVAILLVVVTLFVVGFSLFTCLKRKKSTRNDDVLPMNNNTFQANYPQENIHLRPLPLPGRGMDTNYDYPNAFLSSNSYVNNTLARAQANGGATDVALAPCPAYSPVYSEVRSVAQCDPPCDPCPAYASSQTMTSIKDTELETSEHIYY